MKRISIIGPSGSGKSTLAVKLGNILDLPVYHVDAVIEQVDKVAETDKWIIDGHRMSSLEKRIERSDLVILLNFPIDFCIASVNQRDNTNRLGSPKFPELSDEGFRLYCLKTLENWSHGKGNVIRLLAQKYKDKFVELKTRKEVDDFLNLLNNQINI